MLEFAKKLNFDLNGVQHPQVTLIVKSDDPALIAAVTETVRKFSKVQRVIEEATIPAEDASKLVISELNLFPQEDTDYKGKISRYVAKRRVEAIFADLPTSVSFRTLGDLYKYMTGKDTSRAGKPETHIRMLNKKRLPNRLPIVRIIRMDAAGREYTPTARKAN
jgi:hypothetical protein